MITVTTSDSFKKCMIKPELWGYDYISIYFCVTGTLDDRIIQVYMAAFLHKSSVGWCRFLQGFPNLSKQILT